MDIQRSLIISALILVSIMLLKEWVDFRDAHMSTNTTGAASPNSNSADTPTVNSSPTAKAVESADLPRVETKPQAQDQHRAPDAQQQTITVNTDTLQLRISLSGGDITSVALPRHLATLGKENIAFQLLENSASRMYVAQSGLVGENGIDSNQGRAIFSASSTHFEMTPDQQILVVDLHAQTAADVSITKRFRLHRGEYVVDVEYDIQNKSDKPWQAAMYGQLKRDNSPDPGASGGKLGIKPFLGFATHTKDKQYQKFTFKNIGDKPYNDKTSGGWIALVQHYFIGAWIPDPTTAFDYEMLQTQDGTNIGRFTGPVKVVRAGESTVFSARFYAGPKDQYRLRQISPGLELTVDYGWLWWIAQPLFALLHFFATGEAHLGGKSFGFGHGIGNWGWSIILLTILVKAAFFRLAATSYKSMAKMRKLQPKMIELRERHADDRQKLSQETMELYRREKVNPLGGCLPIVIQMPVFLALYWVLLESVELRHAPFIGWIHDLSVMDPYYVLPLLMGASMYFQQKLNPPPPDPVQAKVFQFMPIAFTVFFIFFPAGLVLYWLVNNLLSIAQQWVITRRIEHAG